MSRSAKRRHESETGSDYLVVYARLHPEDYAEMKRREEQTGAPISAQIRILVHEALRRKAVIR